MASRKRALIYTFLVGGALAVTAGTANAGMRAGAAQRVANANVRTLGSYKMASLLAPGPLRSGGCKRLAPDSMRCLAYRTAFEQCRGEGGAGQPCQPLTKTWKTTLRRARSGGPRAVKTRVASKVGFAGPCFSGPCVSGIQNSGGSSVEGAARAAVLSHPSFAAVAGHGDALRTQSCSEVAPGRTRCLLYKSLGTPCSSGSVCAQVISYRYWLVSVVRDAADAQHFAGVVDRHWNSYESPAR